MRKVDPDDPQAPFQQVADDLRSSIHSGELQPGVRLPKQSELADGYGVSLGTVKSALGVLREEGLIVSRQGEGSWVRRSLPDLVERAASASANDVPAMLERVLQQLDQINTRLARIEERQERL
ncbi:GntR family transcriptional regulator [Saccharopolyspora sp. 6V]|uniref:GntR family transcriptional regulator n=1 Tax=Saccharopolyspora sp. 6V TaxID=2877239 RepID=UPI001CD210AE|nr:GntR family transcriptional regulator [Saccharopolyspora sp. 6V]MCA1194439.1 GntR family transcriptional regulator [Saccharopolyspora sp. 6V]